MGRFVNLKKFIKGEFYMHVSTYMTLPSEEMKNLADCKYEDMYAIDDIFKNIGVKDSIRSMTHGGKKGAPIPEKHKALRKHLDEHGTHKRRWFVDRGNLIKFLSGYTPQKEETREILFNYIDFIGSELLTKQRQYTDEEMQGYDLFKQETKVPKKKEEPKEEIDPKSTMTFTEASNIMNIGIKKDLTPFLEKIGAVYRKKDNKLYPTSLHNEKGYLTQKIVARTPRGRGISQTLMTYKGLLYYKKRWEKANEENNANFSTVTLKQDVFRGGYEDNSKRFAVHKSLFENERYYLFVRSETNGLMRLTELPLSEVLSIMRVQFPEFMKKEEEGVEFTLKTLQ